MYIKIIDDWIGEGITLNVPADSAEIAECEAVINFSFPDDFKCFYAVCNGFAEWEMDSKMLSLWPLNRISSENHRPDFIAFADYNVSGSLIGYLRGQNGLFHDYNDHKFCDSFDEFIDHWRRESGEYI